jgi:7-cyano-7-deazaguanine synthase in queuosine biosynthesis
MLTTYINLSGGVDSAYYLYRWMKENPKDEILVHHCLFNKSRKEVEDKAAKAILAFFDKNGMKKYRYVTTTFNRGTIKGAMMDVEVMGALSGLILRCYPSVKTVLMSYCHEETPRIRKHLATGKALKEFSAKERTGVFMRGIEVFAKRPMNFVIPYMNKTKGQMLEELPKELREVLWFCRKPKDGKPCERCFNCRRVLPKLKNIKQ